jgi:ABC-type multidrug transport system fused ATPase/permease subunit
MLVVCLLAIEWRLGLQCLIPTGFCWWIYRRERQRRLRGREVADSHVETEVGFLAEGLHKTRLVRGYGVEEFEQQRFQQHLGRLNQESQLGRRQERWLLLTGAMLLLAGGVLVSLLIGLRVLSPVHSIPLASGAALAATLGLLMTEVPRLERTLAQQSVLFLAAERVYRYLDEIPEVSQAVGARFVEPIAKSITFEAVGYRRDQKQLLQGLDLKLTAKSQIALVSLDPHLPRTVAYMLPRFIEPSAGRVLFDGQDIAWGTLESIRAEVIYVGGDDPVLNGTVSENLLCGDPRYTTQDASEAAKLAHAHSFIMRLPQGYETVLGEHGTTLQPGQAFRLSLARAILRNPAVLIIDEPTDPLDEGTKSLIDDAYQRLCANRTIIYLPSRLTTVRRCDQVVLLHEGKVEAIGKHSDLRKNSDLYRHWDYTRFNAFRRATGDLEG